MDGFTRESGLALVVGNTVERSGLRMGQLTRGREAMTVVGRKPCPAAGVKPWGGESQEGQVGRFFLNR